MATKFIEVGPISKNEAYGYIRDGAGNIKIIDKDVQSFRLSGAKPGNLLGRVAHIIEVQVVRGKVPWNWEGFWGADGCRGPVGVRPNEVIRVRNGIIAGEEWFEIGAFDTGKAGRD